MCRKRPEAFYNSQKGTSVGEDRDDPWPGKTITTTRTFDLEKWELPGSQHSHFQCEERPCSFCQRRLSIWIIGNSYLGNSGGGSRKSAVVWDPPFLITPDHATRNPKLPILSLDSLKKLFSSSGIGRVHTFSRIKAFFLIGLDHGKVPTNMLHKKQLFKFWQGREYVRIMPKFVIRLLTKEQPIPDPQI